MDNWYALGYALNKIKSNSIISGATGDLVGTSYYLTSGFLLSSILRGDLSAALLTTILFKYDLNQRNTEGDKKVEAI